MQHVLLRRSNEVSQHLHALGMLQMDIVLVTHGLHEALMDELALHPPVGPILERQEMVSLADDFLHDVGRRPVACHRALFFEELARDASVGDDGERAVSDFDGVQAAVGFGEFRVSELSGRFFHYVRTGESWDRNSPQMRASAWDLMDVSDDGECWWTWSVSISREISKRGDRVRGTNLVACVRLYDRRSEGRRQCLRGQLQVQLQR
jgi:hypothetical protein